MNFRTCLDGVDEVQETMRMDDRSTTRGRSILVDLYLCTRPTWSALADQVESKPDQGKDLTQQIQNEVISFAIFSTASTRIELATSRHRRI